MTRDNKTSRIEVCPNCRGEGTVTVYASRSQFEQALLEVIFNSGEVVQTVQQTCRVCNGGRVVRRVKTITYEPVVGQEEPPEG